MKRASLLMGLLAAVSGALNAAPIQADGQADREAPDESAPPPDPILARTPASLPRAAPERWAPFFADGANVEALGASLEPGVAAMLGQAEELYRIDDFPGALTVLYQALEHEPDLPPALLLMGTTYFRLRRYEDARLCLERFVAAVPSQIWRTQALGHCYYSLGDYRKAKEHYAKVLEGLPDSPEAVRGLALAHMRLGDFDRALELLDRVLEMRAEHDEALTWKAQILYEDERSEEALSAAEEARDLDPFDPRPWFLLTQIYADLGRTREAEDARERWRELDRVVQRIRSIEGRLLYRPAQYPLALELVQLHSSIGDKEGVRRALDRMVRWRPPTVTELDLYVFGLETMLALNDMSGAAKAARMLEEHCSDEPEAWRRLRDYYARIRDRANQIRAGERYLRLGGLDE